MTASEYPSTPHRIARILLLLCCAATLGACSSLRPDSAKPPAFYSLDVPPVATLGALTAAPLQARPTLVVTPTRAASGFDSQRIIFIRTDHQLEYFAHSEWVDTPARMLRPLLASALERTEAFSAIVLTPASATGDVRLDTEIIRLQHSFRTSPSRVQFVLRAYLVDDKTRKVLAWREFQSDVQAPAETPQGGVAAANAAVQEVLAQLAGFLVQHKAVTP
ncbi:ABC-type transport auxiliary lipoprotein family protein [Rhodoferax saidenbachensis]|uniref:Cholesterol transport system auxiliary component n=1 Tax=Rhodoferax saidenbachensis TaxID=1484693 RepID=A0ABU1ZLL9_9BURK|nr:ABC-type transport auxiliary lipoprotein family protein [Rhodoferax saidenbachensis]MDR7305800.1 cholesterol transport system auxiliary component [Rhodoferax saidenbachensis]